MSERRGQVDCRIRLILRSQGEYRVSDWPGMPRRSFASVWGETGMRLLERRTLRRSATAVAVLGLLLAGMSGLPEHRAQAAVAGVPAAPQPALTSGTDP